MTDAEIREGWLEWINYMEDAEHDIDDLPKRVELILAKLTALTSVEVSAESDLPGGAYGVQSESVADLSRSFGLRDKLAAGAGIGVSDIPSDIRQLLKIKARTM